MWANFDETEFPFIKVEFKKNINSDEEFEDFKNKWKILMEKKKHFSFLFDTTKVGWVNPKYAFKMSYFIKELRENYDTSYLESSVIIVNNSYIKFLLNMIFTIQKPICKIYMTTEKIKEKKVDIKNDVYR